MTDNKVTRHYARGDLADAVIAALVAAGKDPDDLAPDDLAAIDEFHIRGREATADLADRLGLDGEARVLDVGSGLGGAARFLARTRGCRVTGLDLSEEYCQVAEMLSARVGLGERLTFRQGDALALPFADGSFDVVWSQHASMNIEDKAGLYAEMFRVLRSGGYLAIYDVMAGAGGAPVYPVPWAREPSISFLMAPDALRRCLAGAGLEEVSWRDRTADGLAWFEKVRAGMAGKAPPPLGFHVLLGPEFAAMAQNQARNLGEGRIALIETIWRRP